MRRRRTIEFVKEQFEKEGYTLLSTEYKNSFQKLECICDKGHVYLVRFSDFYNNHHRCKICYLESLKGSQSGVKNHAFKGSISYCIYCENCGVHFFAKQKNKRFCSRKCANTGKFNPMFGKYGKDNPHYGMKRDKSVGKKISEKAKLRTGEKNGFYGKKHTEEVREKLRQANLGSNNHQWLGGITNNPYCRIFYCVGWREYIYERDKDKFCWNPQCLNKGRRTALHHIDYNKKNCNSNNIIKICSSCNIIANKNREWWEAFYKEVLRRRGIT